MRNGVKIGVKCVVFKASTIEPSSCVPSPCVPAQNCIISYDVAWKT